MTAKEIFESIDLSQLPKEAADKFRKVEKATKGFTIESEKVNTFMRGAYKKIKESKPTALKNLKVEEKITKKEVKKGKETEVVENLEYKVKGTKKVSKKTPTPSKPKRKGETAMERAKKIRKKDSSGKLEPWNNAFARAQKELKAEATKAKKDAEKVVSTTSQALKSLEKMIQNDPKLKGYPRTYGNQSKRIDANKDAKIKAKPAGKRVSKKGHKNQYGESKGGRVYWENRDNRSDRYAPNFPNKVFLEMGGETDDLGFPTGHTFLVVEVSPDGTKNLIKSTTDYMTALMSSAVTRGRKTNKNNRVVIVDKEDKKVIHEAFEAGGEITITPTQIVNNPDYLVGTTTMTELFEAGGVTAYQEGGEVFVTPYPLTNAGSADYVAGSNTMSNMFEDGGSIPKGYHQMPDGSIMADSAHMAKGGYVAVGEKDGFWTIISTPTTKEKAKELLDLTTLPKGEKGKIVSVDEAMSHKNVLGKEYLESGGEVTRYSGFRRGEPEDPDTIPFNPTGAVAEFKEDLRALFGKYKSDLNNPEFIKGVSQVMVSWKSLLRSQLYEQGGSVFNQTMDENKAYYKRVLNSFIDNGRFDDDFKGSRFENNPKEAISKFLSRMESFSKTRQPTNAAKYFLLVLDDTYVRNDLFRAFLKSEKDFKKELLLVPSGLNFAKGGKLPKNIKYYGVNEIKEYRLKNGDKIDPSKTFVDSGLYVSATKTMKPKEEEFQQKLQFKKGGATNWKGEKINWKEDYIYIPRYEIEEVELDNGKVIKGDYVVSGLYMPKSDRTKQLEKEMKARMNKGKFEVDDLVYNKKTKTIGIVRLGDDKFGEVKTDADGNVSVENLEIFNPKKSSHSKAKVAPSTEKEINSRGLFNPFKGKLETGGTIVAADPSAAMEDLNQTYGYESVYAKGGNLAGLLTTKANTSAIRLKRFDDKIADLSDDLENTKDTIGETQEFLRDIYGKEITYQDRLDNRFEKGGRLGFEGLAKKVAKRYEGKPVKAKYQKEYGKTYSKEEAMEVGRKVAAKVYGQQQAKMEMGGQITQPYSLINSGSADYVAGSNTMSNMFKKGGSIPEGYHQMPDGSIMADSAHMAKGGEVDGKLNLKVKDYLDTYLKGTKVNSPEYQESLMLILKGALRDANYHSEAREVDNYFPKAGKVYIDTPMEDVIEDKGVDIAKMAKWDGHKIIDAFAYYTNLRIGGGFGNKLMALKGSTSFAKGGELEGSYYFNVENNGDEFVMSVEQDFEGKFVERLISGYSKKPLNKRYLSYLTKQDLINYLERDFDYVQEISEESAMAIKDAARADSANYYVFRYQTDPNEFYVFKDDVLTIVNTKNKDIDYIGDITYQWGMNMRQFIREENDLIALNASDWPKGLIDVVQKKSFAKGGSLMGHGLKSGDVIMSQEGYLTKILDKDGKPLFVNLQDGYRGREKPLPFAKGGAVSAMKIPDIAKKFGKTTADVFAQLQVGEKHEMEHTNDPKKARKIALDHLSKDLDYYTKLNKLGL